MTFTFTWFECFIRLVACRSRTCFRDLAVLELLRLPKHASNDYTVALSLCVNWVFEHRLSAEDYLKLAQFYLARAAT